MNEASCTLQATQTEKYYIHPLGKNILFKNYINEYYEQGNQ